MERLILLLDDLDDLLTPAFSVVTHSQWLRGAGVVALIVLITGVGAPWPIATMLALPALPLADLARVGLRRASASTLRLPARFSFENDS